MNVLVRSALVTALAFSLHGCGKSKSGDGSAASASASAAPGLLAGGPLAFLQGFEGEIGIMARSVKGKAETVNLALALKSDKIRMEIPQGIGGPRGPSMKGFLVLNTPEKKLYAVLDEQKQVIVLDLNTLGDQIKGMAKGMNPSGGSGKPTKPPPKLTKTGTTDKVAGYTCDNWEVTDEAKKVATLCIADQSSSWFRLPLTGIPAEYAWALELLDGKHFPMRGVGYENGAESGRVEVTKMEKKPIAASLFEMPAGYKVIDAMSYMQQAMGGRPGAVPGGVPGAPGLPKKPK